MKTGALQTLCALLAALGGPAVLAGELTRYHRVDEVMDWGAATTRLIVELGADASRGAVGADTFDVHVRRRDPRLAEPLLEEGAREVVEAYVSDEGGTPVPSGRYATLVMAVGPTLSLGNALNFAQDPATGSHFNAWTENAYTITQQEPIDGIEDLVATEMGEYTRLGIDDFVFDTASYRDPEYGPTEIRYAHWSPPADDGRNPLIVWLHGGGEGGTDPTIPLAANRAPAFVADDLQAVFGGAYVLVPQSPTWWMHGPAGTRGSNEKQDALSIYTRAVQNLVEDFVADRKDVDADRVYVAGASNGGWLTVRLLLDYPHYYAAAVAVCEPLNLDYVSEEELRGIVDVPLWLVTAATDRLVKPEEFPVPLYTTLRTLGAKDVHLTLLPRVEDMSGEYVAADGTPHEYDGHWSWIPFYNDHLALIEDADGVEGGAGQLYGPIAKTVDNVGGRDVVTVMEWLAAQSRQSIPS
ncbi:MAG TPA: prolyl oligopeptidase family serine peptidase, partial [Woeseiaceae bacterium]|nr:prolyl oligopeptidase family serine peptidase [Woeseiaceae bacterium]